VELCRRPNAAGHAQVPGNRIVVLIGGEVVQNGTPHSESSDCFPEWKARPGFPRDKTDHSAEDEQLLVNLIFSVDHIPWGAPL
jgi:hypothetical protein